MPSRVGVGKTLRYVVHAKQLTLGIKHNLDETKDPKMWL